MNMSKKKNTLKVSDETKQYLKIFTSVFIGIMVIALIANFIAGGIKTTPPILERGLDILNGLIKYIALITIFANFFLFRWIGIIISLFGIVALVQMSRFFFTEPELAPYLIDHPGYLIALTVIMLAVIISVIYSLRVWTK